MIHAAIYQMRSDANAICHHHASALPFCSVNLALHVVTQLGAAIGKHVGTAQPLLHLIFESLPCVRSAAAVTQSRSCVRYKRFDRQIQCEEIDLATTFPERTLARASFSGCGFACEQKKNPHWCKSGNR
jgi:Class II Aldolase and Adducin N-terminal domain